MFTGTQGLGLSKDAVGAGVGDTPWEFIAPKIFWFIFVIAWFAFAWSFSA
jgi:hypothetical protein